MMANEGALLRQTKHANIIGLIDAFESSRHMYVLLQYTGGKSLHRLLEREAGEKLSDGRCRQIFRQVVSALEYLHGRDISHRDVKLDNILVGKTDVKLIDFGMATRLDL